MSNKDDEFMKMFENGLWLKYLLRVVVVYFCVRIIFLLIQNAGYGYYGVECFLEVIMYAVLILVASYLLVHREKL